MSENERDRQDQLVVSALHSLGEECESIYDFVNGKVLRNQQSIDVLSNLLPIVTDDRIKEGIVRTLYTPQARGKAEEILVREFRNLPRNPSSDGVRWAIGNTLGSLDLKRVTDDILDIVSDERYGSTRRMIVLALNKLHDERVVPLLIKLLQDESVRGHAIMALRKAKAKSAIADIQAYASDKNPWIRRTVKSALASLRK